MAEAQKNISFSLNSHDRSFIENNKNKQKALRTLINEGYDDIKAGRVTEYKSAEGLFNDIMEE